MTEDFVFLKKSRFLNFVKGGLIKVILWYSLERRVELIVKVNESKIELNFRSHKALTFSRFG